MSAAMSVSENVTLVDRLAAKRSPMMSYIYVVLSEDANNCGGNKIVTAAK